MDWVSLNFSPDRGRVQESQKADGILGASVQGRLGPQDQQEALSEKRRQSTTSSLIRGTLFAQTHPDRLATLAPFFGLEPAPLEACLGPRARARRRCAPTLSRWRSPCRARASSAIDAAPKRDRARPGLVAELGLENVTLEARAIAGARAGAGGFDYVIAHGVYSWVAGSGARSPARGLPRARWRDAGVAYVSYNALPGGRLREALRDMLRLPHRRALETRASASTQARALLRFLLEGAPGEHELGALMRGQAESMLQRERCERCCTTSSPRSTTRSTSTSSPRTPRATACSTSPRPTSSRCRSARPPSPPRMPCSPSRTRYAASSTSTSSRAGCSARRCCAPPGAPIDRTPRPAVIERLAVSTQARPREERDAGGGLTFEGPSGSTLTTDHPLVVEALRASRARLARRRLGARPGCAGRDGRRARRAR